MFLWTRESESGSCSAVSASLRPLDCSHQAPLSMGFSRQEHWSGLPLPFPGDLPHPGIEPRSPALGADSLPSEPPRKPLAKLKYTEANLLHVAASCSPVVSMYWDTVLFLWAQSPSSILCYPGDDVSAGCCVCQCGRGRTPRKLLSKHFSTWSSLASLSSPLETQLTQTQLILHTCFSI